VITINTSIIQAGVQNGKTPKCSYNVIKISYLVQLNYQDKTNIRMCVNWLDCFIWT